MAKPHAKTLQERMGFTDPDLKTPGHDAIMHWLDEQIQQSPHPLLGFGQSWYAEEAHPLHRAFTWFWEERRTDTPPPAVLDLKIIKTTWEQLVRNHSGFEVGFVDLDATCRLTTQDPHPDLSRVLHAEHHVWCEVKTTISSLGELFRQLSLYRQYLPGCEMQRATHTCPLCRVFVVCPDTRFADKIREQGYGFIQSPGGTPPVNGQGKEDRWLFGSPS